MSYKIFEIYTSIRSHNESFSSRMANYCSKKIQSKFQGSTANNLDLYRNPIPYLTNEWDEAAHTPLELRTEKQNQLLDAVSMKPLIDNDIYIIALAGYMYDAPAVFKSFLEHMAQFDVTINPDWSSRLHNKKIIVITAWGDDSDDITPEIGYEFVIKKSFEKLGLNDIQFFNIYRTDDISATADDVQTKIDKYVEGLPNKA